MTTATATVTAPAETGRAPYFTKEALERLLGYADRLQTLESQLALAGDVQRTPQGLAVLRRPVRLTEQEWLQAQRDLAEAAAATRGDKGTLAVQEVGHRERLPSILTEAGFHLPSGRIIRLSEAASTREFPTLLRAGLRTILFNTFSETPTTYDQICFSMQSDKDSEVWLEMSRLGTFGQVDEGEEYPRNSVTLLPQRRVANVKYGNILEITEEMIKFDRTNQIMQIPADRGAAARQTLDSTFYTAFRTTGNYSKTSSDNNVGNNTSSNVFSPSNFITAWETITTMKEARSGRYLNVVPNILVVGSGVWFPATQLFKSPTIQSGATTGTATAALAIGGPGGNNPLFGTITNIVVNPWMARYEWALGVAKRGWVYQEVEPLSLVDRVQPEAQEAFTRDVYEYRARLWFGFGIQDDRYWYFSNATSAPTWS